MFDPCTNNQTNQALMPPMGGVFIPVPEKVPEIALQSLHAGHSLARSHFIGQLMLAINSPAQGFGIAVDA